MTRQSKQSTRRWILIVRELDNDNIVELHDVYDLDLVRANALWDTTGSLDGLEPRDWHLYYQYPVLKDHLSFIQAHTEHVIDLERFRYFVVINDLTKINRRDVGADEHLRTRFHGVFGAIVPRRRLKGHNARWRYPDGRLMEYDPRQDRKDLYTADGRHLGKFSVSQEEITGDPEPGRRINPKHPAADIPPPVCWSLEWRPKGEARRAGKTALLALGIDAGLSLVGAAWAPGPDAERVRDRHPVLPEHGRAIAGYAGFSLDFDAFDFEIRLGRRPSEPGNGPTGVRYAFRQGDNSVGLWNCFHGCVDLYDADGQHLGIFDNDDWSELVPPLAHRWLERPYVMRATDTLI